MSRKLFLNKVFILLNLLCSPELYAQPTIPVYQMPAALVNRLKAETAQRQRGECEQKQREFGSHQFYALNNAKLLLLIGLPDYFCNASSFMPVTIDKLGHWETGAVLENYPTFLLTDSRQQLWLTSHWEIEGVYPVLQHSIDGVNWQEVSLPKERHIDCCFQYLKQVCLNNSQIQLKFTGIDDTPVEYWATGVTDSLKSAPDWKKTSPQPCQATAITTGDWQRKTSANGTGISFESTTQGFKVVIPRWLKAAN